MLAYSRLPTRDFRRYSHARCSLQINEDFFTRTVSGGIVTLVASFCMLLLFLSEFSE